MSETIAVIVFIILMILLYKIIAGYIGLLMLFGIIGAAVGVIFGDGIWQTCAYIGAAIGLVFFLVKDFDNVWRTVAGLAVGGGVGWLIGLPFGSGMWSSVVCLAGALIGACVVSPAAYEAMTRQSKRSYSSGSNRHSYNDSDEEKRPYNGLICNRCEYYNDYEIKCNHTNRHTSPTENACTSFSGRY